MIEPNDRAAWLARLTPEVINRCAVDVAPLVAEQPSAQVFSEAWLRDTAGLPPLPPGAEEVDMELYTLRLVAFQTTLRKQLLEMSGRWLVRERARHWRLLSPEDSAPEVAQVAERVAERAFEKGTDRLHRIQPHLTDPSVKAAATMRAVSMGSVLALMQGARKPPK